ncbi:MAG: diphosphate--fructose-6-phosphate 1-phosphotransferase [Planctomycetota bacterium]|nr:diphosphate--fructose-6-phosphate 1-phosphotransferase [Planctomycetota bacterium]MDI6787610.1 diphosphate--fructose-6-phosphate 1-phosphotransferase [Planctomycetota bacterium]
MQKSNDSEKFLGILVGGGPAPGINGVISAATIESINYGWKVIGILDGFKHLAINDITKVVPLTINSVSRIHFDGGSIIRTSRENPTKDKTKIKNVIDSLLKLSIDKFITIGGDDTAYSASVISKETEGKIRIVHVPKTIDNDLPLPENRSTFGFHTARQVGVQIIQNIMEDASTTNRWYFIVAMGRKAGHLALSIGKASGATISVIAEEFKERTITLSQISDILEGAIIKRLAMGREHGVAILAEGLAERLSPDDPCLRDVEKDEHDHLRLSEIDLGKFIKNEVKERLDSRGIKITIVDKDIGYELRCAPPVPYDCEYTRDLGYGASKFLQQGGSGAMVCLQGGKITPICFPDILDPLTGKTKVRYVDVNTESYEVARSYMIRLEKSDFNDPEQLDKLCRAAKLTKEEFLNKFIWIKSISMW